MYAIIEKKIIVVTFALINILFINKGHVHVDKINNIS